MQFAKRSILVLLTPIFPLLLFATAFDMGVTRIVGHPGEVKKIINDSGIYNNAVTAALNQAKNVTSDNGSLPLTDPSIQAAATSTFTPQTLQNYSNQVIDGVYDWLNGKTAQPDFKIDLSSLKSTFAQQVAKAAETKAAALPTCSSADQISSYNDVFSSTCLPPNVTPAEAGSEASSAILNGQGFLDNPVITANNVKGSDSNQSVFNNQLKNAPAQYRKAKRAPWILSLLTILVAAGIVFLSATWQKGLRHIGITLAIVGVFMLLFAWALNYGVTKKAVPKISFDNSVLTADVKALVTDLAQSIDKNYWEFGTVYTVLGAAAIATPVFLNRRNAKPQPASTANSAETADKTKAERKPPTKLVQ